MTHHRRASLPLLALALSVGCGDGAGTFIENYVALEAQTEAQVDLLCDCHAQLLEPYETKAECVTDLYAALTPDELECIENAGALAPQGSNTVIRCELAAAKTFTTCLEQRLDCGDLATFQDCQDQYDDALFACPAFPVIVDQALVECLFATAVPQAATATGP